MFFPQFKLFIVCQTQDSQQQMLSEQEKKERNELLISSAEKKYMLFNSISVILQHSHLFQTECFSLSLSLSLSLFFFFFFFLIWLVQAKILRDVPKTSSSVQWNKSISCINTPDYKWNCITHFCLEPTNSGSGEGFTMKHVIVYLDG